MVRLTSELWVSALLRRVSSSGAYGYVRRRGSSESGSIFILVDDLSGSLTLYSPSLSMNDERLFERRLVDATESDCRVRLESEERIDSDMWVIEIEDRLGRLFFECVDLQ